MAKTKRALITSVLSLAVCVVMLLGSTFAWFTDSVVSAGNIIKSGKLDVELAWADGKEDPSTTEAWQDASKGAIFDYGLWEPGYTEVRHVKISNVGSLAFKYEVKIAATGTVSELANVIDVYYIKGGRQIAARTDLTDADKIGTLAEVLANPYAAKGNLQAAAGSDVDIATIALKMQESAGDTYQEMSIGSQFAIQLVATQDTVESDSFDNLYDEKAEYPAVTSIGAGDADALEDALNNPGVPTEITLDDTLSNLDGLNVTGDVTMNMGNNMLSGAIEGTVGADISATDGGRLTINAVANSGFNYTAGQLKASGAGSAITVNGGSYGDSGSGNADVTAEDGAVVTLNSGRFSASGYQGHAVMATSGGTLYINGGSYSTSGADSITVYADGGTIYVEGYDSIRCNGRNFGVANGGIIYISKAASASQPTSIAAGCTVTDGGEYWVVAEA